MKLGCRYLLAAMVSCGLAGCTFVSVGRRPVARQPAEVTVYNVYSTPQEAACAEVGGPPAHAPAYGWHRKHRYYYYPSCQVYHSPQRNCYIWRGPRGWVVTARPPEKVVLSADEAVTCELDGDGPAGNLPDNDRGKDQGKNSDKGKGKDRDRDKDWDKDRDKDWDKNKDEDQDQDQGKDKDKDQDQDKGKNGDQGHGKGEGKDKDKDKDKDTGKGKGNGKG